jgi:cell filamentation protein
MERRLVVQRSREGAPTGDFDLRHLRAIHRHLFQDVYDWAGEIRTVEIAKGGSQFRSSGQIR